MHDAQKGEGGGLIISVSLLVAVATRAAALCRLQQESKPNMLRNVSKVTARAWDLRTGLTPLVSGSALTKHRYTQNPCIRRGVPWTSDGTCCASGTCWSGVCRSHHSPLQSPASGGSHHLLVAYFLLLKRCPAHLPSLALSCFFCSMAFAPPPPPSTLLPSHFSTQPEP